MEIKLELPKEEIAEVMANAAKDNEQQTTKTDDSEG